VPPVPAVALGLLALGEAALSDGPPVSWCCGWGWVGLGWVGLGLGFGGGEGQVELDADLVLEFEGAEEADVGLDAEGGLDHGG
jgi:hypothetical protein